ncbi:MAG: ATP-binding protein [Pseudomonadota bacterium]
MIFKSLSIGRKLFVTIIATVVATIMFFAVAVYWNTRSGISEYILAAEIARFDTVAFALADAYDPDARGWPELAKDQRAFDRLVREYYITAINPRPGVLNRQIDAQRAEDSDRRRDNQRAANRSSDDAIPRRRSRDQQNIRGRLSLVDEDKNFIVGGQLESRKKGYHPIDWKSADGEKTIVGYLSLAMPNLDQRAADLLFEHNQLRMLAVTGLLALILSIIAAFMLSRVLVSPINELLSGAKKLSDGRLDTRLNVSRNDEMGELQAQFNNLAETLESNERAERQWISDTSHELRTPLAILRAEIEALQDGVRKSDVKTLSTLHESVIRLSTLVQDISVLAHAREGVIAGVLNTENLSEVVRDYASAAEALLQENGLELEMSIEPNLLVDCDSLRIGQLVDNLISNSNRYTDAGGKLQIKMFRQRRRVFIHFEDTGPCPSSESIPKLFDRFYRDEKSRSRASGGSGLGLPICGAIVVAHGGNIHAERSSLGGLKIVIAIPMQQPGQTV